MIEFFLYYGIKVFAFFIRLLPPNLALAVGRWMGTATYWIDSKHRYRVYVNLKTVFGASMSLPEIKNISRRVFENFGQNIVDLLRLPLLRRETCERYVSFEGKEHIEEALKKGKGVIQLAMHYGSWEIANFATAMLGHPYKVIVNPQHRFPKLDSLLNKYRECGGSVIITKGLATRDFIRSLHNNEIVGLVMDQGGKDGALVPFFNRQTSMAVGAIRVGLKMGVPICFSIITRESATRHRIIIHPPLELEKTGDAVKDLTTNMLKVTHLMEEYIRKDPTQYMWFYKIWKYSNEVFISILNDGRTGHLRQSQAVAALLEQACESRGIVPRTRTLDIRYRNRWAAGLVSLVSLWASPGLVRRYSHFFAWFLTKESFAQVLPANADFIISCGSRVAGMNYLLSQDQQARSIVILKPGLLSFSRFDLLIMPQHDCLRRAFINDRIVITQGAPNLISARYLQEQTASFVKHFSHLQFSGKLTLGLLIGGDTKYFQLDEPRVRQVVHQILEAAEDLDAQILATTSRRTPEKIETMLQRELKKNPRCRLLIMPSRNNIPEAVGGILGFADIVVVSGDSISMVSEAASSGKKTIVFPLAGLFDLSAAKQKHGRFLDLLHRQNIVLLAEPAHLRQAVCDLAKNKIQLKALNDRELIDAGLQRII